MYRFIIYLMAIMPCFAMANELPAPVVDADYRHVDFAEAALGQLLFYDPLLLRE